MTLVLAAATILVAGGCLALILSRAPGVATVIGAGSAFVAGIVGLVGTLPQLLGREPESLQIPWQAPYGSLSIELDPLTGLFLLPIFAIGGIAAVYGAGYLGARSSGPPTRRPSIGRHWFCYNLLIASMAAVVVARNGVLFLFAWELMTLASYFLVVLEDDRESVRDAGWTYLVAAHLGGACLLGLFVVLSSGGSFDLDAGRAGSLSPIAAGVAFALAFAGFGTKAGLVPFHVWLPDAHAAAPSHVSALMSGVMIKTGIYGILRTILLLGAPQAWWGWMLIAFGAASAIFGILSALVQTDLKRMLAFSTVENAGLLAMAMGLGVLGWASRAPALCALGFGGAFLHILSHSLAKSLLFFAAGSVLHGSGSRDMDHLGGLEKRMRWTGLAFLVGAISISGLPPLGGFPGEFLTLLGALSGASRRGVGVAGSHAIPIASLLAIASIALTVGLAVFAFTRAFGIVFLGEPRRPTAARAHEANPWMLLPMGLLALSLIVFGILSPWVLGALAPAIPRLSSDPVSGGDGLAGGATFLLHVAIVSLGIAAFAVVLGTLRRLLLRGREVREAVTWGCGYAQPTARMQYTASSFAQPVRELFRFALRPARHWIEPRGLFPGGARLELSSADPIRQDLYARLFCLVEGALARARCIQGGRVQIYVLYVAITALLLLLWKLA